MSERLWPKPNTEARQARRLQRSKLRPYHVNYDLAYDSSSGQWTGHYRTKWGAKTAAWWNVHVSSWGGTATLTNPYRTQDGK